MAPHIPARDILRAVDDYYSVRLRAFGPTHLGVDWRSEESQRLRFDVLLRAIRPAPAFSLIDYGCGYGALADHLAARALHHCEYVGHDISDAMIAAARGRPCPLVSCRYAGRNDPLPDADYCVASGVFNVRLGTEPEVWFEYMTQVWDEMNRVSRLAFAFNCLSAVPDVARRTDALYHADPARVVDHCRRRYSPWVTLLHDYPLPEFTVIVGKPPPGA